MFVFQSLLHVFCNIILYSASLLNNYFFQGLVDEMFGITCATVSLVEPEKKTLSLSSQEDLYQELRGLNFNAVGPTLSRKAKSIKAMEDQRHQAKTPRYILLDMLDDDDET